ncbi:hypothetical protein [Paenibacillus humicus]|uniref:hypothetical protein n=1 Tax=Paenibacillus humicus TaxID=412861 RepID=UPI003F17A561
MVFTHGKKPRTKSLPRYFSLVLLNYGMMLLFHSGIGIPLVAAKLMTEASLFLISYRAQRRVVYD